MLAAFAFGRFSASYLMRYVDPPKLMSAYSIMNIGLLLDRSAGMARHLGRLPYEFLHVADVPTIFASGLCGLGPNTKLGGPLLVMGIVGGAVMALLMGWISRRTQIVGTAYAVPLVGYVL